MAEDEDDDRAFLNDPTRWPRDSRGVSICAIKQRSEGNKIDATRFGMVIYIDELREYLMFRRDANWVFVPTPLPVTVDALIADGWLVD